MKIFAVFVVIPGMLLMVIAPRVDTYKKHKSETPFKRFLYSLRPLLVFIGMTLAGFVIFEFIPKYLGEMLDNMIG